MNSINTNNNNDTLYKKELLIWHKIKQKFTECENIIEIVDNFKFKNHNVINI